MKYKVIALYTICGINLGWALISMLRGRELEIWLPCLAVGIFCGWLIWRKREI